MRALHLFFQLHQPYSLKVPEGGEHEYFAGGADFREAEQKYYQPFFALLERNTQRYPGLKVSLLVSGPWLEQAEQYAPDLVRRLMKLVDLKQVELIATPYYYSLSAFYDKEEFQEQVATFRQRFEGKFGTVCQVFAAPGLLYHDCLAKWAEKAGFVGALAGDATEILKYRNANQVYDAAGCEKFRVLFENGQLSQALMEGDARVLAEVVQPTEDFAAASEPEATETRVPMQKRRATAAEFVRGRAGAVDAKANTAGARKAAGIAVKRLYSAKKLQKELDMACLRGNLVSLCLDAKIFGMHREEGIIACFDEFFANWLKVPGNKFLSASEILGESSPFTPKAEISVKATVRTLGMRLEGLLPALKAEDATQRTEEAAKSSAGLAKVEEVQYTLPHEYQSVREGELYELRERTLKTKNDDLLRDFRRLTTLDYAFQADFDKVLTDFEARVDELMPKPKQLRSENAGKVTADEGGAAKLTAKQAVMGEEEPEPQDDYTVKVHRILKKAAERPARPEDYELEGGEEPELEPEDEAETEDAPVELDDREEIAEMLEAFDAAEAEVQVIAQRMKRSKHNLEHELEALMEAEVVTPEPAKTAEGSDGAKATSEKSKKKVRHRIVLD